DNSYRQLASSQKDIDHEIQDLFVELPGKHYQEWLRRIGNQVSAAVEKSGGCHVEGVIDQKDFWKEFVRPHQDRTAVFLIDALRYELQRKLLSELKESGFQVNHSVMTSALPSITEVGMSSLLPHESLTIEVVDGKLRVFLDGSKIATKAERQEWLRSKYGEHVAIVDLDSIKDQRTLTENAEGKKILVVMDREIDKAGRFITRELLDDFDRLSDKVKRGVKIATRAGYSKVLVTTDHGFLFLPYPEKVESVQKIALKTNVASGRRYAVGRPPKVKGSFSLSLKSLGYDGGDLQAMFPTGIAFFPQPGSKEPFIHGGISLQEWCIGVLEITVARQAVGEKVNVKTILPDVVTSAIFTVSFQPVATQLVAIPRKLIVEVYVEEKLVLLSDPIDLAFSQERLTIKLPKISKKVEVRVKDVETEEILHKRSIPVALEGYDELL
nr:PglZ domain-containing protein [Candidatus Bathyarchaeota archaeon]